MSRTIKIERDQLPGYFAEFTRRFLLDESPESADIALLDRELGAQFETESARLRGITYDDKENALEFELEAGDHRLASPREVWVREEDDGFASAIEVVHQDGLREVVTLKRAD